MGRGSRGGGGVAQSGALAKPIQRLAVSPAKEPRLPPRWERGCPRSPRENKNRRASPPRIAPALVRGRPGVGRGCARSNGKKPVAQIVFEGGRRCGLGKRPK